MVKAMGRSFLQLRKQVVKSGATGHRKMKRRKTLYASGGRRIQNPPSTTRAEGFQWFKTGNTIQAGSQNSTQTMIVAGNLHKRSDKFTSI